MIKSHVLYRLSYGLTEGAFVGRGRRRVKGPSGEMALRPPADPERRH